MTVGIYCYKDLQVKQSIYYDKLKKELNTILFGEKKCK